MSAVRIEPDHRAGAMIVTTKATGSTALHVSLDGAVSTFELGVQ